MIEEVLILDGQSRYNVFKRWQNALVRGFGKLGIAARVAPVAESVKPLGNPRALTLGFNLVRQWSTENWDQRHLCWMVDHPSYHADFFFPRISGMPVNPDRVAVASVDRNWAEFARARYGYGRCVLLPHASGTDTLFGKPWKKKRNVGVFFGSIEDPAALLENARRQAGPFLPVVDLLAERFSYRSGRTFPDFFQDTLAELKVDPAQALMAMNALLPLLDMVHIFKNRLELLRAVRGLELHLYGAGPWRAMGLPANVRIHDAVEYETALEIMAGARLLVNHSPSLSGGGHERIFEALCAGCCVMTTPSDYLAGEFGGNAGLRFYTVSGASGLDDMARSLLDEPGAADRVAASAAVTLARHTMASRAATICVLSAELWPEVMGQ